MKVGLLLLCSYVGISTIECAAVEAPLDIISLDDISPSERKHLQYLENASAARPKRSGLLSAIGETIKSKIGMLAHGSASASASKFSHLSGGSSGGHNGYDDHHHVPETYDSKAFDFWSLKKSVLNTLLQAAKAIKGGIIALKGHLIKGSGYLVSAKGKLISAKGEAITNIGKNIAASALLSPFPEQHQHSSGYSAPGPSYESHHVEYGPPSSHHEVEHIAPSSPNIEYGIPDHQKPPSHAYEPEKYAESYADEHKTFLGPHSGILILKKIHDFKDSKLPTFKPLPPEPTFPSLLTTLLSSSSHPKTDLHKKLPPPSHEPYDAYTSYSLKHPTESKPTQVIPEPSTTPDIGSPTEFLEYLRKMKSTDNHQQLKPTMSTSTGNTTIESQDFFSNINKDQEQLFNALNDQPNIYSPSTNVQLPIGAAFDTNQNPFLVDPYSLPSLENFGPYPGLLPTDFVVQHNLNTLLPLSTQYPLDAKHMFNFDSRGLKPNEFTMNLFLPTPLSKYEQQPQLSNPFTKQRFPTNNVRDRTRLATQRLPTKATFRPKPPGYEVVESVAYQLGPRGPTKL